MLYWLMKLTRETLTILRVCGILNAGICLIGKIRRVGFLRGEGLMRMCFHCGAEIANRGKVPFKELCPKCEAFLHCCRNCRFYSASAHNHCLSNTTEHVPDMERGNYCDEFQFREYEDTSKTSKLSGNNNWSKTSNGKPDSASEASRQMSARDKFNSLFKD